MPWTGKTIVFDLDGTLVDTAPDLHAALQYAYQCFDLDAIDLPTVRSTIGHGARAMIMKSAEIKKIDLTEPRLDELHRAFLEYYTKNMTVHSKMFDGMEEVLDLCLKSGATLAVCTNKTQSLAEQVLQELGQSHKFSAILGADKTSEKKPSPTHIRETVSLASGTMDTAVMIGDSSSDGLSAFAADIPFVFMTYGYPDDKIADLKPDAILDSAGEIPAALNQIFS